MRIEPCQTKEDARRTQRLLRYTNRVVVGAAFGTVSALQVATRVECVTPAQPAHRTRTDSPETRRFMGPPMWTRRGVKALLRWCCQVRQRYAQPYRQVRRLAERDFY